jgi:thiol:disulfide interchange protein DsbC
MIKTLRNASVPVIISIISVLSMNAGAQSAEKATEQSAAETIEITDELLEQVRTRLVEQLPGIGVDSVSPTQIPGLYELITDGQIYYVDEAAEFLVDGNLIQLSNRENLTDARLGGIHMGLIKEVGEENMLIYEPEEASSRSITIFTDISCGYCRRLHAELDTLLDQGVRVRYLLFPRAGLGSQGHKDLESVWCAENPQEAMTNAKAGGEIEPKSCDNPIEQHVALAERVGLRGTPLIYTDSGEKVPGYREAAALAGMVNGSEPLNN